jgi:hypothetical protein
VAGKAIWEPSSQQRELLRAGLWSGRRGLEAWNRWRLDAADIDVLEEGSYRLLPLVYDNLGPLLAGDTDAGRLKGVYRRSWAANQIALRVGRGAIDALHEAGLEFLALKGGALIATAYDGIGARPMADLDLAVRAEGVGTAIAALEGAGFEPAAEDPARALRQHHSTGFTSSDGHEVDLHRGTLWRVGLDDRFWAAAVRVELADTEVLALSPADQLLHVCAHGAGWNVVQPIRWVADSYKILEASGEDGVDWQRLTELAAIGHFAPPLHDALAYMAVEMEAPIPPEAIEQLAAVPVGRAERRAHEALAQPPSSRRSLAMLWWFWERHRAQASLDGTGSGPVGLVRYLQGFWGLERPTQVPGHALRRLIRHGQG